MASGSPYGAPKKRLGQHFLKDPNTARIVADGVTETDTVLEIGPGRGALTTVLAGRARLVHAVELDPEVLPELQRSIEGLSNVEVYLADAMKFDYSALEPEPGVLCANLPYNVGSPLVLKFLEEVPGLRRLRFMVQLEVARRMAAAPRSRDYGAYSVLVQALASVRLVHRVSPRVFEPQPRVWSAVVELERREPPMAEYAGFKELVAAAFVNRRKRLARKLPDPALAESVLVGLGFGVSARAEELSPGDFAALLERTDAGRR